MGLGTRRGDLLGIGGAVLGERGASLRRGVGEGKSSRVCVCRGECERRSCRASRIVDGQRRPLYCEACTGRGAGHGGRAAGREGGSTRFVFVFVI